MTSSSKTLSFIRSISCRIHGHDFCLLSKHVSKDGLKSETQYECSHCGTAKTVTATITHDCCPDCGGNVTYDETRPKTYVGTDTYCDDGAYGEWVCDECGKVGEEDFSDSYIEITETIVPVWGEREFHVIVGAGAE